MGAVRGMVVAAVIAASLAGAADALACSCATVPARQAVKASDAAVVAELVRVEADERNSGYGSAGEADFHYRIKRVYKGRHRLERGERLTIRSSLSGASCGLPDQEGRKYGLVLYRRAHRWQANLCTVISPRKLRKAAKARRETRSSTAGGAGCGA